LAAALAQNAPHLIRLPIEAATISSCCSTIHRNMGERRSLRATDRRIALVSRRRCAMQDKLPRETANGALIFGSRLRESRA
jgi:hypothetical protein